MSVARIARTAIIALVVIFFVYKISTSGSLSSAVGHFNEDNGAVTPGMDAVEVKEEDRTGPNQRPQVEEKVQKEQVEDQRQESEPQEGTQQEPQVSTEQGNKEQKAVELPAEEKSAAVIASSSEHEYQRANATFVTLARNEDIWQLVKSIRHVEDRFNRKYKYDWVFLNDNDFNDEFKKMTTTLISGTVKFGKIPKEHWGFPDWIDQDKAGRTREQMREKNIIYGDSISYRHMCRFESGFFSSSSAQRV